MSTSLTRRQIAKGAAWAAPVVIASAAVPAYAASANEYGFSASWYARYDYDTAGCPVGQAHLTSFWFWTDESLDGEAPGFAIPPLNGSPDTGVTLNNISFEVAFPAGVILDLGVASGSYAISGPSSQTINGSPFDVWTFTFTGPQTGTTSGTTSWPESQLVTDIVYNDVCVPTSDLQNGNLGPYYVQWHGSYTTDNGVTNDITKSWLETNFAI